MKKLHFAALVLISFPVLALSDWTPEKQKEEKAKMMAVFDNPPTQQLQIANLNKMSEPQAVLVHYFVNQIWPDLSRFSPIQTKSNVLYVAIDRGLYDNEEERLSWKNQMEEMMSESAAFFMSDAWKAKVKKFNDLAGNQKGDLAEAARKMWRDIEVGAFPESETENVKRMIKLESEIQNISNNSPVVKTISQGEQEESEATSEFFAGKVGFEEGWKKIEHAHSLGKPAHGQDIAKTGAQVFNELAIVRTKLAKSKNYKTWAQYKIATQADSLEAPFNTVKGLKKAMQQVLDQTRPAAQDFLNARFSLIPGADPLNRRYSQLELLKLPSVSLIQDYFPKEKIEEAWTRTMTESGFEQEDFENINLDGYPRDNKMTHAYMFPVTNHEPKTLVIDGGSLNVQGPPDTRVFWNQALINIVQNYRSDGYEASSTAWHEGGHGLNYVHKRNYLSSYDHAAEAETHSMTQERFFTDPDFLVHAGRARDGKTMTREIAETFVKNFRANYIFQYRIISSRSLFDLDLWDYDYETGGADYMSRTHELFRKYQEEATLLPTVSSQGIDYAWEAFMRPHFYGGNVNYFGYQLADIAAEASAQKLLNDFKAESGRRSFVKQPTMAKKLIEGYYRDGSKQKFPLQVEAFTGQKYDMAQGVQPVVDAVNEYVQSAKGPSGAVAALLRQCNSNPHLKK